MKAKVSLAAMFIALLAGCAAPRPVTTVREVDLKRYSGTWHEIARYPNWFQRNCAGGVTATYSPLPDGSIRVVNACRRSDGSTDTAEAKATVVPGSGNAKLNVSFGGPFAGDYWIIGLDPNYRWALVGHPSRRFLWILARDPSLPKPLYDHIAALAAREGYNIGKIRETPP